MICNVPCLVGPHTSRVLAEMLAQARPGKTQLILKWDLLVSHLSLWSSESQ